MRVHPHRLLALLAALVIAPLADCYHRGMTRYPGLSDAQQRLIRAGDSTLIYANYGQAVCWYQSTIEWVDSVHDVEGCIRHTADTTMYLYRYPDRGLVIVGRTFAIDSVRAQGVTDSVVTVMTQRYGNEEKCPPIQDTTEFDSKHYRWRSDGLTVQLSTDSFGRTPAMTLETYLGDWKCSEWQGIPLKY